MIDCKKCHQRFRADKLIEEFVTNAQVTENSPLNVLTETIVSNKIKCPHCGSLEWTDVKKFNLMFKTFIGVDEDTANIAYLRPETCQSIFVDFAHVVRTSRQKLPFSICQIGKSFRNEITPGNFIFRTREFEQAEMEYFTYEQNAMGDFEVLLNKVKHFLLEVLKFNPENLKYKDIPKDELAHYSKRTVDTQYNFPHGFSEL
ncbi:hypothetical protein FACS189496_2530 [Bacilli bacterium]|nr:hypothetical protein FACS189496_2430 [Bacilli bacterium]GHU52420.1 hypothetical protein FACS189496_2530 [Bacilli bacterium]